jgi:hypothetical protein
VRTEPAVPREINHHSAQRAMHADAQRNQHQQQGEEETEEGIELRGGRRENNQRLRQRGTELQPKRFSIEGLPEAPAISESWMLPDISKYENGDILGDGAAMHTDFCKAALSLDLAAIRYLLYEIGIPADSTSENDGNRNAFHCLSLLFHWGDASPTSLIFSLLKESKSWATDLYDPPLPPLIESVISSDVLQSLEPQVKKVAAWLQRAGVPVNVKDTGGNTPLHYAAYGGSLELMKVLIEMGADVDIQNKDLRTPLHYGNCLLLPVAYLYSIAIHGCMFVFISFAARNRFVSVLYA